MGTLVWAAYLISEGRITIGTFASFWFLLDFVFGPIRELAERYNVLQAAMAAGERIFGIFDADTENGPADLASVPILTDWDRVSTVGKKSEKCLTVTILSS